VIFTPYQMLGDRMKAEIGGACGTHGKDGICLQKFNREI
jgi:hypothetical protein